MAHFAQIDTDGTVLQVVVADDVQWLRDRLGGTWRQTSYTASIRKNYAGIGYRYDAGLDAFVPPQPAYNFDLNTQTARWEFPIGTDVIYVLVATESAVALSQQFYSLVNPGREGMYCGVVPHATRTDVALLQLRTTDVVPIALGADPSPLVAILSPYVEAKLLTQAELDGIVDGIRTYAGNSVPIETFIPTSWLPYKKTRVEAIAEGWLA